MQLYSDDVEFAGIEPSAKMGYKYHRAVIEEFVFFSDPSIGIGDHFNGNLLPTQIGCYIQCVVPTMQLSKVLNKCFAVIACFVNAMAPLLQ